MKPSRVDTPRRDLYRDEILTLPDVAARLRIEYNERRLKRLIRKHQIAYLRVGRE